MSNQFTCKLLLFSLAIANLSCDQADQAEIACWTDMSKEYYAIRNEAKYYRLDSMDSIERRTKLGSLLASCKDIVRFSYSRDPSFPAASGITILDIAIATDNSGAIDSILSGLSPSKIESLKSEGAANERNHPLFLAMHLESETSYFELRSKSFELEVYDSNGFGLLHAASGQTRPGLRMIADVVNSGQDVDMTSKSGSTPMSVARERGDIGAVQCLRALGASVPNPLPDIISESMTDEQSTRRVQIDEFLISEHPRYDDDVATICRVGSYQG